jgi:hypothetical protein
MEPTKYAVAVGDVTFHSKNWRCGLDADVCWPNRLSTNEQMIGVKRNVRFLTACLHGGVICNIAQFDAGEEIRGSTCLIPAVVRTGIP